MKRLSLLLLLSLVAVADTSPPAKPAPSPDTAKPLGLDAGSSTAAASESQEYELDSTSRGHRLYPSNWGTVGLFRVRSGEAMPAGALSFGIGGEFYTTNNASFAGGNVNTIAEMLFVGYAVNERLSFGVQRRNSSTTYGVPRTLISSLGDFNFTGQYTIPVSRALALAPIANFLVASDFNNLNPSGLTLSGGGGLAATLSLFPATSLPLFIHANLIYHSPQVSSGNTNPLHSLYGFSRFHTITLGLGAEYELGDVVPFVEWNHKVQASSSLGLGGSPANLTLGARFTPLENKGFALLLGTDVGIIRYSGTAPVLGVPYTPSFQVIGQASYTFGFSQTERKHFKTTTDVNVVNRKFVLNKNVNFKVGKAELEPSSHELLDQIAEVVQKNQIKKLLIVGHTDSSHSEDYNLKLSNDRAQTVRKYLMNKGIPEEGLMAQGYGKRKPKASNLTEEGRQINRRVEFFVVE